MIVIVIFSSVPMRLFGISLASLSSGLGEMTFLQLTTRYPTQPGVTWFASGTGAAGVVGAALWWLLRRLGVQIGLGLSSILPICLSVTYFFLLPSPNEIRFKNDDRITRGDYTVLAETDEVTRPPDSPTLTNPSKSHSLSLSERLELAKPLLVPFMLPLFTVYFAEYTINTGIAPTLLYPIPSPESHTLFSMVFKSLRDYYPFWQLTYQTFVFFSRSSMAIFRLPALPKRFISLPSMLQVVIFITVLLESSTSFLSRLFPLDWVYSIVFLLISFEGICGGFAYVSTYHWLGLLDPTDHPTHNEFRMACVGFSDTFGILMASVFSSWLEPRLCGIQVSNGRTFCRQIERNP